MSVQDRTILITGAASGIGLATAHYLASKGAKLSLADIQEQPLLDLKALLQKKGAQVLASVVDITNRKAIESWIEVTISRFGKIDGAANLAGVLGEQHGFVGIVDIDDEEWDHVFNVNTKGLMMCLRAEVPHMKSGGAIVNMSSVLGLEGGRNCITYATSKHAVIGITRSVAKELGDRNIRVNCICP
jgi:NAD(P)-dependent dehydrogenase (short-subunit alcohol dehydrogenase family)